MRIRAARSFFVLLSVLFILTGCSDPLPEARSDYAGEWRSSEMNLTILQNGTVFYKRIKGRTTVTVNGPIQEFAGDNFTVGFWLFSTSFEVNEPPARHDGSWQMVVDGVRLTRIEKY
jgi:hypothetical protein